MDPLKYFYLKNLQYVPVYKHLLNELKTKDVYIDTDSDRIFNECNTLSKVTCYKRDTKHIKLENNIEFVVSPVLLMIENFLNKYVQDENEVIITPHVTSPYITLKTTATAAKKDLEPYIKNLLKNPLITKNIILNNPKYTYFMYSFDNHQDGKQTWKKMDWMESFIMSMVFIIHH